jgi:predicted methyltransferase
MGIHLASNAKKYKNTKKFCVVDLDDSFINVLKRCASAKKIDNCKFFNSLEDSFSDAIPVMA